MISRAQATLEFTLVFIIAVALLMGLIGLWKWSSDNIVKRQLKYNQTRLQAGSLDTPGEPGVVNMIYEAPEFTQNQFYLFKK